MDTNPNYWQGFTYHPFTAHYITPHTLSIFASKVRAASRHSCKAPPPQLFTTVALQPTIRNASHEPHQNHCYSFLVVTQKRRSSIVIVVFLRQPLSTTGSTLNKRWIRHRYLLWKGYQDQRKPMTFIVSANMISNKRMENKQRLCGFSAVSFHSPKTHIWG